MKIVVPTSFQVLRVLDSRARQTAPNLAELLDRETSYMSNQLADLASQGLVRKVGPSDNSSMYEITSRGRMVLEYAQEYTHDRSDEFRREIVEALQQSDLPEIPVLKLSDRDFDLLTVVPDQDPSTPDEIADQLEELPDIVEAGLSYLQHQGLIEELDDRKYHRTSLGKAVINHRDEYANLGLEQFTVTVFEEAEFEGIDENQEQSRG